MVEINFRLTDEEKVLLENYKPGVYDNMIEDDYHAHIAIGSTDCKNILENYEKYRERKLSPSDKTPLMVNGSAAHCYLLQKELFDSRYSIIEVDDKYQKPKQTKQWKEGVEEAEAQGKMPLLSEDFDKIKSMAVKMYEHEFARKLMSKGLFEQSLIAEEKEENQNHPILVKARPDFRGYLDDIAPGSGVKIGHYIVDYKTTKRSLRNSVFTSHFGNMDYDIQATHYAKVVHLATGDPINNVFYVVQSSEPPYTVRVFRVTDQWSNEGDSRRFEAWQKFSLLCKHGKIFAYQHEGDVDLGEVPPYKNQTPD